MAEDSELVWVYCVLAAGDPAPSPLRGVAPDWKVERIECGDLAALASRVPRAEFGPEPLREHLNDLAWLERVARAHEAVLDAALAHSTIVPLRLCTLFEDEGGVRRMLEQEHPALAGALAGLAGRQELGVKLLVDPRKLEAEARATSDEIAALSAELEQQSGGGAYMLRRRVERQVREQAHALAAECADDVVARLERCVVDVVTRPPQNRELSGHEGEMLVNAACLVATGSAAQLLEAARDLEARHARLGARVEVTGPWPPYNFVPGSDAAVLA